MWNVGVSSAYLYLERTGKDRTDPAGQQSAAHPLPPLAAEKHQLPVRYFILKASAKRRSQNQILFESPEIEKVAQSRDMEDRMTIPDECKNLLKQK